MTKRSSEGVKKWACPHGYQANETAPPKVSLRYNRRGPTLCKRLSVSKKNEFTS